MGINSKVEKFLREARLRLTTPAIVPSRATMTPPGAEIARLELDRGSVGALAVLPDGRLASGSHYFPDGDLEYGTIRLWDLAVGEETAWLEGHEGDVCAIVMLPDELVFASGSADGTIRLWDPATGRETAQLRAHKRDVLMRISLAVLPDGRLASGFNDGFIRLWDLSTGKETARLKGHEGYVCAIVMLPDGRLASGSADGTIRLWDLSTGKETARIKIEGRSTYVEALVVLLDGAARIGFSQHNSVVGPCHRSRDRSARRA